MIDGSLWGENSLSTTLASGERLELDLTLEAREAVEDVTLGVLIRDRFGQDIFGVNTFQLGQTVSLQAGERQQARLKLDANIAPGKYTVTVALHSREHHLDDCYWWCDSYLQFEVAGFKQHLFSGICRLPTDIQMTPVAAAPQAGQPTERQESQS